MTTIRIHVASLVAAAIVINTSSDVARGQVAADPNEPAVGNAPAATASDSSGDVEKAPPAAAPEVRVDLEQPQDSAVRLDPATPAVEPQGKSSVRYRGLQVALDQLGLEVEESTEGLVISDVVKLSLAARVGLQVNDIIISVNGQEFRTFVQLTDLLAQSQSGDVWKLELLRKETVRQPSIALPDDFQVSPHALQEDKLAAEIESLREELRTLRAEIAAFKKQSAGGAVTGFKNEAN
jgi:membrane-associated protease RseP (regulator of RpoE activity)